jgi:hypothetical protein
VCSRRYWYSWLVIANDVGTLLMVVVFCTSWSSPGDPNCCADTDLAVRSALQSLNSAGDGMAPRTLRPTMLCQALMAPAAEMDARGSRLVGLREASQLEARSDCAV